MRTGKTKKGVDIKETQGMRAGARPVSLVLVASNSQAQIFDLMYPGPTLAARGEVLHPEGRLLGHELVEDRPGRAFGSRTASHGGHQTGPARHSFGGADGPQEDESERWAGRIAQLVDSVETGGKGEALTVVAEPRLLGRLRPYLARNRRFKVAAEFEKDFSWISGPALTDRLLSLFTGRISR